MPARLSHQSDCVDAQEHEVRRDNQQQRGEASQTSRSNCARTQKDKGTIIPVVISIFQDRSFTFITKTPPVAILLKKAAGIVQGSGVPNKTKVGSVTMAQVEEIAKIKLPDLNTVELSSAVAQVVGTARSMGLEVK